MEWTRLLSTKRQRQNRYKSQKYGDADLRSEFEKDYQVIDNQQHRPESAEISALFCYTGSYE